jgi:SRSO17 transposase
MSGRLVEFCAMITHLFAPTAKRAENTARHARIYIEGLLSEAPRKNSEAIADAAGGVESQDLQNFIADSKWEESALFEFIAGKANGRLGDHPESMLALDEVGFTKKGKLSAGVARQYNGRLGKVDNCQVGVFSALVNGPRGALVGARLLLPEEWTKDPQRCLAAGVPVERIAPTSKPALARELIEEAESFGVRYARIGMDSFYGRETGLLCWIEDRGGEFYADIPSNSHVWLKQPAPGKRPASPGKAGATRVDAVLERGGGWKKSKRIKLRDSENGPVKVDSLVRRVWVWGADEPCARQWWLLMSRDAGGTVKYTLSNAPAGTAQETLARRQGQRHFIERTFQNSKSHLGMADYQVRKWRAWHRHMAMVATAGLFVLEERLAAAETEPLLSVRDIVQILDWYFRKSPSLEEVIGQVARRHERRKLTSAKRNSGPTPKARRKPKKYLTV